MFSISKSLPEFYFQKVKYTQVLSNYLFQNKFLEIDFQNQAPHSIFQIKISKIFTFKKFV